MRSFYLQLGFRSKFCSAFGTRKRSCNRNTFGELPSPFEIGVHTPEGFLQTAVAIQLDFSSLPITACQVFSRHYHQSRSYSSFLLDIAFIQQYKCKPTVAEWCVRSIFLNLFTLADAEQLFNSSTMEIYFIIIDTLFADLSTQHSLIFASVIEGSV